MLSLIYGTNASARHDARARIFEKFRGEGTSFIVRTGNELNKAEIEQFALGSSLFGERYVVSLEYPSEREDFMNDILENFSMLVDSPNTFIIIEREMTKDIVDSFKESGADIVKCDEVKNAKPQDFSIFSLTDAFLDRDKKKAWLLYREAREHEHDPNEIAGVLFWAIKNMMILQGENVRGDGGLSPFVAKKVRAALPKWRTGEVQAISRELIKLVHQGKSGQGDLDEALEQFIIEKL